MNLNKIKTKIFSDKNKLALILEKERKNKKIVFTNGCFDIIHRGHIEYLAQAADLADIFVIGLNTDNSVNRIKGENRPVQDEKSRAYILSALQFVDYIVYFDEDTPYELIKTIKPDFLIKGSDYNPKDIVGYDILQEYGGLVKTIDFVDGYSTTKIIDKIIKAYSK